jgi:hypothetical protein
MHVHEPSHDLGLSAVGEVLLLNRAVWDTFAAGDNFMP